MSEREQELLQMLDEAYHLIANAQYIMDARTLQKWRWLDRYDALKSNAAHNWPVEATQEEINELTRKM